MQLIVDFTETRGPIEAEFHMEHPMDETAVIWLYDPGHTTKMASKCVR